MASDMNLKAGLTFATCLLIGGCSTQTMKPSPGHVQAAAPAPAGDIPEPVRIAPVLPKPKPAARPETYSVVVNNVNAQELLFALARDAKLNIDIHSGIVGSVTLNAIDQTLQQLLARIARQVDMRYELDGPNLAVMRDTPYLRHYKIDYVNMQRDTDSKVGTSTQVATPGASAAGGGAGGGVGAGGNQSTTFRIAVWLLSTVSLGLESTRTLPKDSSSRTEASRLLKFGAAKPSVKMLPVGDAVVVPLTD